MYKNLNKPKIKIDIHNNESNLIIDENTIINHDWIVESKKEESNKSTNITGLYLNPQIKSKALIVNFEYNGFIFKISIPIKNINSMQIINGRLKDDITQPIDWTKQHIYTIKSHDFWAKLDDAFFANEIRKVIKYEDEKN